jgi:hypothetical protein
MSRAASMFFNLFLKKDISCTVTQNIHSLKSPLRLEIYRMMRNSLNENTLVELRSIMVSLVE